MEEIDTDNLTNKTIRFAVNVYYALHSEEMPDYHIMCMTIKY